ncbi:hypothetical protein Acr_23g0019450 [Actinidia rufa]|uniref:Reverse transcriptase zinc-binding domain-containing protein n=1 Tax=Actinidia rufa TaxID=165716 RepID=A0A7J0GRW3_9ERIC|nr:hypothetical protein Acr_23g0019450 [Actinidia rufa]
MVVLTFKDPKERDTMFNEGKMAEIGKSWGEVIMLADDTIKNLSFAVGKVIISTTIMDLINKVMELDNNGSLTQIRVMEEQLVVNTVLRADSACPGCQVEASSLHKPLDDSSVQSLTKKDNGGDVRSKILGDVLARFKELQRWNLHFRRALLDRKTEALEELNELLAVSGVVAAFDRPDQLVWRGCSSGEALCSFCNSELESLDHLLLHCTPVWECWVGMLSQGSKCSGLQFPLAVGWAAWNVKNQEVFDNKPVDWLEATELIIAHVAF